MARPRQVSDEEILDAACQCFLEHGPGCSTSVVAERLGISQAAVFKRFGTKQELMLSALLPPAVPEWSARLASGPDSRPIPEQLGEIAQEISSFFQQLAPRIAMLKASGADIPALLSRYDVPPPIVGWNALAEWVRIAQAQGRIRAGDPSAIAMMLIASLHGHAFMANILGMVGFAALDSYVPEMISTVWGGLAPPEAS